MINNMELYRWAKVKDKPPKDSDCFRQLWENPYEEGHTSWIYFNGGVNEFNEVYDIDSNVGKIDQDTVEWLEPIPESEQNELWKEIGEELFGFSYEDFEHTTLPILKSKYYLIKK